MSGRIHYLDWLKVLIVYGILVFHVSLVFAYTTWLVGNDDKSLVLSAFAGFCFPWGIPAMFLIAGADAWFGLRSKRAGTFIWTRALRLLVPMAAGLAVLSPFQRFVTSHNPPPPLSELPAFYASFFRSMTFEPVPEWISRYWLHLWFLGYLFAITAFCVPLLGWMRRRGGARLVAACLRIGRIPRASMLILGIPLLLSQAILRPIFPAYQGWADIATYTFVFAMGAILFGDRHFEAAIKGQIQWILTAGMLSAIALGVFMGSGGYRLVYTLAWGTDVWAWNLAVLYLGIRWLNFPSRALDYARESVLPFYVIHHPVVLVLASFIVTWQLGLWPKFTVILLLAFAATLLVYELGVRRWRVTRALFSLGPRVPRRTGLPALETDRPPLDAHDGGIETWQSQRSFVRGSRA